MSDHPEPSVIPQPAPLIPNGAWAGALERHPRLLGPQGYVQELARRKPELYQLIRNDETIFTTGDIRQAMEADPARHSFEVFQTAAFAAGIRHAVEGLPEERVAAFVAAAMERVARGVTDQHQTSWVWMTDVALVYDLFHAHISPADRERMIAWLNPHLEVFTDDENPFHNSCLSKILCYLRVAYATWGENPRAKDFRDHALLTLYEGKVVPVLHAFGAGGGWTECGWYQRHSPWHLVEALELARRVEGYDGLQQAPRFFYQRQAHDLAESYPTPRPDGTERFPEEGDGGDAYWWGDESVRHLRTMLAQYFRGSDLARQVANQSPAGPLPPARIPNFLYEEPAEALLPLNLRPTAHLCAGLGKVYARSDWSPEATWFRFECGGFWCNHQHYDVGQFEIFRHEPLIAESGEYLWGGPHAMDWYIRTIAHNCVLVHGPAEPWTRPRDGGRTELADDGGQIKKWDWVPYSLEQWQEHREEYQRGTMLAYDNQPEYLYVVGDCTNAYSQQKLRQWIRQIVFLRPHTFVIHDRVIATQPEYEKTWLLHMRNEPEISGDTVVITNGRGRLTARTLLPERAAIRKIHGYTYGGQTFDAPRNHHSEFTNRWRVEVTPAAAQTEDVFLHVLCTDQMPAAALVRDGARVGTRVGEAEVLFDEVGGVLHVNRREIALRPGLQLGEYER